MARASDVARRAGFTTFALLCAVGMTLAADAPANSLTPAEQKEGWKLLFDGKTPAGWRGYKMKEFPKERWLVEDGIMRRTGEGGTRHNIDIITTDTFTDFE